MSKKNQSHETENYSWGVIQDMIEKEISSAFKLREDPELLPRNVRKEMGKGLDELHDKNVWISAEDWSVNYLKSKKE
jgi:hypothetical protein